MSESNPPRRTVTELLKKRRVVICVGAGGVGKTTVSAAIAVKAARAGRRVVCFTIDPAKRLADSLGVLAETKAGSIKDITHILGQNIAPGGKLAFGMLHPEKTFARIIAERASSKEAAGRIMNNKLYRYISGSLSGMHEYMALEQLLMIRNDDSVDLVVLDTPPTTNAMDFFTAPSRMTEALDGRLVRIMRRAYRGRALVGFDFWGRWTSILLRALNRFTGNDLLREMMSFVDALSDLFGSFKERARAIEKVLHDQEVAFVLITTPDKSTLGETEGFKEKLADLGLLVDAVVVNRANWPHAEDPPTDLKDSLREEIVLENERWNQLYKVQERLIRDMKNIERFQDAVVRVPVLPEEATQVKALDNLGRYF